MWRVRWRWNSQQKWPLIVRIGSRCDVRWKRASRGQKSVGCRCSEANVLSQQTDRLNTAPRMAAIASSAISAAPLDALLIAREVLAIDWAADSAFRFFPIVQDALLG